MFRKLSCILLLAAGLSSAAEDPVQWTFEFDAKTVAPGSHAWARLVAKIEPGWHLYSLTTPKGGPIPTTISLAENPAIASYKIHQPKPEKKFDPNFQLDTETFAGQQVFLLDNYFKKDVPAGSTELAAQVRYQCCNDRECLPPKRKSAAASITIDPALKSGTILFFVPDGYTEVIGAATEAPAVTAAPIPASAAPASQGFSLFLLTAFLGGVAAVFTPCVFPMIPFTVSYFLNRQTGLRRDAVTQAVVFSLGIIVLFTGLGLLVKAIAGPFGVVQLGNSPWVNGFIALVFVVFGLSLLGAYELTLPSGLLTKLNQASEQGGYLGTLLMGLTFTLTSFACIGPIVGPLLVASVQTSGLEPVFGMASFATGLAAPFFLLALFPAYLQKLPKSGGWLLRVKVVLGFVVLAIAMKYLSSADQVLQTGFISRELFLATWIVLFTLPGLYLLGFLRLEGIKPEDGLSVGRMLAGALFMIFALSLLPGLFGSSLGNIEAFIPVQGKSASAIATGGAAAPVWLKNQYKDALAQARSEHKRVFINFTGYACTNCHWMKANMFPRPEIAGLLKDFVLVDLYTDGTDGASEENQRLEEKRYGTVAIPFYAIVDADEHVIATFPGLTRSSQEFTNFLKSRPALAAVSSSPVPLR